MNATVTKKVKTDCYIKTAEGMKKIEGVYTLRGGMRYINKNLHISVDGLLWTLESEKTSYSDAVYDPW